MNRNWAIIAIAVALYFLLKWRLGKWNSDAGSQPNKTFLYLTVVFAIASIFGLDRWGTTIPGHYLERGADYKGMFYVNMFPDDQRTKSYRVPAMIEKIDGQHWIAHAQMPNGGTISFENSIGLLHPLGVGERVRFTDDDDRQWGIELTGSAP